MLSRLLYFNNMPLSFTCVHSHLSSSQYLLALTKFCVYFCESKLFCGSRGIRSRFARGQSRYRWATMEPWTKKRDIVLLISLSRTFIQFPHSVTVINHSCITSAVIVVNGVKISLSSRHYTLVCYIYFFRLICYNYLFFMIMLLLIRANSFFSSSLLCALFCVQFYCLHKKNFFLIIWMIHMSDMWYKVYITNAGIIIIIETFAQFDWRMHTHTWWCQPNK